MRYYTFIVLFLIKVEKILFLLILAHLFQLLMPVFPGQLRYIRKNLYHAVYVLDPASICGLEVIIFSPKLKHFSILVLICGYIILILVP